MRLFSILFTCGLWLALPSVGQAQAATAEPAEPEAEELFVERIEVNVVNLLVWVNDKKGRPIHGARQGGLRAV